MSAQEHVVFFPEMWAERGKVYNVVDTLHRGVQNIVLWLYAKNRVFEPYIDKWLFFHVETKAIPEYVYLNQLTELYRRPPRNLKAALAVRDSLLKVCDEIGLIWDVRSTAEAHRVGEENWRKVSEETRKTLSW